MKYLILLPAFIFLHCTSETKPKEDITKPSPWMCAPDLSDAAWYAENSPAPLLEGMDKLHYPISTNIPEAQKFFNQGLLLAYAFNHAEAARSFYQAARLDSTCAMCWWGFAYVLGPNYNGGMEPDNYARAYEAISKAKELTGASTQKEKGLIDAMAARYTPEAPDDRSHLDSAYMLKLKALHQQYPTDVDIAAMYAESLMDMHPWDLWEKNGTAKPWTPEIISAIDIAIRLDPKHPGGHHFSIHAWEASDTPEKAMPSCKVFDDGLVPNAGHLVHMPSHIYINTGDYHLGTIANINAVNRDSSYVTQCHAQGAYPVAYYPHNYHFLAATATLSGNSTWALKAAHMMEKQTRHKGMNIPALATLQHYNTIPYFVYIKFAQWDDILSTPPLDTMPVYMQGIRHYARGMAWIGKNDLAKARAELTELKTAAKDDTLQQLTIWEINSLASVIDIAVLVLEGEILAKESKWEESIALLQQAVEKEDALNYNEPPDWFFSVRHHLGAVLIEAGKAGEAIEVYTDDLEKFPRNGWALKGLSNAYDLQENKQAREAAEKDFAAAWQNADTEITGSRMW